LNLVKRIITAPFSLITNRPRLQPIRRISFHLILCTSTSDDAWHPRRILRSRRRAVVS
jgi:hypothetical protein